MPQEPNYKNLSSLRRNIAKLGYEGHIVARSIYKHTLDFVRKPNKHNFVDIFVEGLRASPYFWGHGAALVVAGIAGWYIGLYIGNL